MSAVLLLAPLVACAASTPADLRSVEVRLPTAGPIVGAATPAPPAALGVARFDRLELVVEGRPGARVAVALAARTGARSAPAPLGDPGRVWLAGGPSDPAARLGPDGRLTLVHDLPGSLPTGLRLGLQALTVDEGTGVCALSPTVELAVETRLEFDFTRSPGGWTLLAGEGHHEPGVGWHLAPDARLGHALANLAADRPYAVVVAGAGAPPARVAAGPGPAPPAAEAWAPLTSDPRELRLTTGPDGAAWLVLRGPSAGPTRIAALGATLAGAEGTR